MLETSQSVAPATTGHSADVQLYLHTGQQTIRLAQVGHDSIKSAEGVRVPAGAGRLEVVVDGVSHTRAVTVLRESAPGVWASLA